MLNIKFLDKRVYLLFKCVELTFAITNSALTILDMHNRIMFFNILVPYFHECRSMVP